SVSEGVRSGSGSLGGRALTRDDAEDVALLHDEQVLAFDLDLGARPLAEQDTVTGLDDGGDQLARVLAGAFADGDDFTLGRLFLGGVGDDQTALGLLFTLNAADEHAVVQRRELHGIAPWLRVPILAGGCNPFSTRH